MKTTTVNDVERFAGDVVRGDDEILAERSSFGGRRVALLGDPTSVTRLASRLAHHAGTLTVFQDEGVWVLPRAAGLVPLLGSATGVAPRSLRHRVTTDLARRHLRQGTRDGWTRRQLTPRREPTPETIVYSDRYHRTLRRDDVRLVTWPIAGFVAGGIRTADGIEHHVDVLAVAG